MVPYFCRPIRPDDAKQFMTWMHEQRSTNNYDPDLLQKQAVDVIAVSGPAGVVAYEVIRKNFVMDSIAWNPSISTFERAKALEILARESIRQALAERIAEVEFQLSEPTLDGVARRMGWDTMPPRLRLLTKNIK